MSTERIIYCAKKYDLNFNSFSYFIIGSILWQALVCSQDGYFKLDVDGALDINERT